MSKSSKSIQVPFTELFKEKLLKATILSISILIVMNTALYTITTWIPTIFVQSGITVTKSLFMTAIILFGAPVGVLNATQIIDRFPRK